MMRDIINIITLTESKQDNIEPVELPYDRGSLSPVLSSGNLGDHFRLWSAYCDRFNNHEGEPSFQYAGAMLHNIFFSQFRSPRINNVPNGPIGNLIKSKFKDWDNFKEQFADAAVKVQGSGWVYLARSGEIRTIQNHQLKPDILILVDMWEHAYINGYSGDRRKYVNNIWRIMDWNKINSVWAVPYRN
jgi:superoxide dismutase